MVFSEKNAILGFKVLVFLKGVSVLLLQVFVVRNHVVKKVGSSELFCSIETEAVGFLLCALKYVDVARLHTLHNLQTLYLYISLGPINSHINDNNVMNSACLGVGVYFRG